VFPCCLGEFLVEVFHHLLHVFHVLLRLPWVLLRSKLSATEVISTYLIFPK
jgi:hypothetical protein